MVKIILKILIYVFAQLILVNEFFCEMTGGFFVRKRHEVFAFFLCVFMFWGSPSGHAEFSAVKVKEISGYEVWAYPSVSKHKVDMVSKVIQEAVKYFEGQGVSLPDQARKVLLVGTKNELTFEIFNQQSGVKRNMAFASQIAINAGGIISPPNIFVLADSDRSDNEFARVVAHEVSHAYQMYLGKRTYWKVPVWFREGTADYWSTHIIRFTEPEMLKKLHDWYVPSLRGEKTVPYLAELGTVGSFQSKQIRMENGASVYAISLLAVDDLIERAGEKSLVSVLKNLEAECLNAECSPSPIFMNAFKSTFGLSLDEYIKIFADKLQQKGFRLGQSINPGNYPEKDVAESRDPLPAIYKGYNESWGPTFVFKEFDKIAPPPGVNWIGDVYDWFEQAGLSNWKTSTDPLRPQVGAILIRADRSKGVAWVYIVREVNADAVSAEFMIPTGKRHTEILKLSELQKMNFTGYIYPIRTK